MSDTNLKTVKSASFWNSELQQKVSQVVGTSESEKDVTAGAEFGTLGNLQAGEYCPQMESYTLSAPTTAVTSKSTLATLQELFPPPISMIPVCVMQPAQVVNKPAVSKVLVLQCENTTILPAINQSVAPPSSNCGRKVSIKKTATKPKKEGRKTVRELLQEKYGNPAKGTKEYEPRAGPKVLKPIFKLAGNNVLIPIDTSLSGGRYCSTPKNEGYTEFIRSTGFFPVNPSKRPNIMVLPSAKKDVQDNASFPVKRTLLSDMGEEQEKESSSYLKHLANDVPSDLVCSSAEIGTASKDCRPRNYDMCELWIGYFKVEECVVDSCVRFQSKFKILFGKRQFIYEFPVSRCNQVDDVEESDGWARILILFETVEAINAFNRRIHLQLNTHPQIYLWKVRKPDPKMASEYRGFCKPAENSMWNDAVQNSLLHKITLRKRQADNLMSHLCQFDPQMISLFTAGSSSMDTSIVESTPYEEELLSTRMRKLHQKNKKTSVRRLPQWDSEMLPESPLQGGGSLLLPSNHVCSCRVSCRSMRCSCVKAAKSCSTGGSTCLCSCCDNPLNVLESLGLDRELCLGDRCLFQNIYKIPRLRSFLERNVKLSCCNTMARIVDCIPSTILCPNTECNACLEFSWCRGIICYPERNPRNHCSHCGQCCFSNGRHCLVCNRCYTVTPKRPDCPNCRRDGVQMNPVGRGTSFEDSFYSTMLSTTDEMPTRSVAKPEIILLDTKHDEEHRTGERKNCVSSAQHCTEGDFSTRKETFSTDAHDTQQQTSDSAAIKMGVVETISGECPGREDGEIAKQEFSDQLKVKQRCELMWEESDIKVEEMDHTVKEVFFSYYDNQKGPSPQPATLVNGFPSSPKLEAPELLLNPIPEDVKQVQDA